MHLLVSSHPYILGSSGSYVLSGIPAFISIGLCVLAFILASLHLHILRFISFSLYPRILAFSYPQVHACLLVFLHFTFSYHQVHVCLLVSLQAFVLEFYCTSRKICWKQPLRADLKKVVKIQTQSLKNICKGINFLENLHPRSLQVYKDLA